jgi:hypothetical protein
VEANLRPLTLGEILDRTAQLYRSNFLLFAGISAVYAGVMLVLSLVQIGSGELLRVLHMNQYVSWVAVSSVVLFVPLSFIFAGAAMAANNRAVSWVNLGEPATIGGAYASIRPRIGRYLWLMTLAALIIWTPFVIIYGGYVGLLFSRGGIGVKGAPSDPQSVGVIAVASVIFFLLIVGWIVYAILMSLRFSLAVPACVVEDLKARAALRRSVELSQGSRGRILLLGILVAVIQVGLVLLAQMVFIVMAVKQHGLIPVWARVLQQVVGFLTNSFIGPMYSIGLTLFYYDQRIRKEGFDIEWMMQAAGLTPPQPVAELAAPATSAASTEAAPPPLPEEPPPAPRAPAADPQEPGSVHE